MEHLPVEPDLSALYMLKAKALQLRTTAATPLILYQPVPLCPSIELNDAADQFSD